MFLFPTQTHSLIYTYFTFLAIFYFLSTVTAGLYRTKVVLPVDGIVKCYRPL